MKSLFYFYWYLIKWRRERSEPLLVWFIVSVEWKVFRFRFNWIKSHLELSSRFQLISSFQHIYHSIFSSRSFFAFSTSSSYPFHFFFPIIFASCSSWFSGIQVFGQKNLTAHYLHTRPLCISFSLGVLHKALHADRLCSLIIPYKIYTHLTKDGFFSNFV